MDEPLIRYKNVNINQQELGVLEDVNLEFIIYALITTLKKEVNIPLLRFSVQI